MQVKKTSTSNAADKKIERAEHQIRNVQRIVASLPARFSDTPEKEAYLRSLTERLWDVLSEVRKLKEIDEQTKPQK